MNSKIRTSDRRGEVFYDADCSICWRGATRWGRLFERKGFRWVPLQTPGVASRLKVNDNELRAEIHLQFTDGCVFSGADVWSVLFRSVWWLWPIGVLIGLPGIRTLSVALYRWLARHRHRISRTCRMPHDKSIHHRHASFLEKP